MEELTDIASLKQENYKVASVDLRHILDEITNKLKFVPEWGRVSVYGNGKAGIAILYRFTPLAKSD